MKSLLVTLVSVAAITSSVVYVWISGNTGAEDRRILLSNVDELKVMVEALQKELQECRSQKASSPLLPKEVKEPVRPAPELVEPPRPESPIDHVVAILAENVQVENATSFLPPIPLTPPVDFPDKLYYIYELDEEFWWRWPQEGSDCSGNGYVGHEHSVNSGFGPAIRPKDGLFLTWHFSLFSSLYNRLKRSKRRTYDPEKASMFIVPYDLGLDGYVNHQTCGNSRRCTAGLAPKLQDFLFKSKYWNRNEGRDHLVLWSLGQYHPWPHNGCDIFMRDFCKHCTFTCYWMDSTKPESRFISVPFPSAYHWWDGIESLPWEHNEDDSRPMFAVYLGSTQTLNPAHTKIRRAMTSQCNASSECHWKQIQHSSKDGGLADLLSVYRRAVFCLCPPGDDPARKAVFDAIVSGCIPVIFLKETLYNQYPWHLGESKARDISVYIPGHLVRAGQLDFMSVLLAVPKDIVVSKQRVIAQLAPQLQYSMPPLEYLQDRADVTRWDPPFADGVDRIVDGVLRRISNVLHNETTNIPPPEMLTKAWHQQYDVVIAKRPDEATDADSLAGQKPSHHKHHRRKHRIESANRLQNHMD